MQGLDGIREGPFLLFEPRRPRALGRDRFQGGVPAVLIPKGDPPQELGPRRSGPQGQSPFGVPQGGRGLSSLGGARRVQEQRRDPRRGPCPGRALRCPCRPAWPTGRVPEPEAGPPAGIRDTPWPARRGPASKSQSPAARIEPSPGPLRRPPRRPAGAPGPKGLQAPRVPAQGLKRPSRRIPR